MAAGNEEAPRISAEVAASLAKQGWAVVDGFFSENFAEGLRDEIVTLAATGRLCSPTRRTLQIRPAGATCSASLTYGRSIYTRCD